MWKGIIYLGVGGRLHSIVAYVLDCDIIVMWFEFELYVHFQTNTLGKGMNPLK